MTEFNDLLTIILDLKYSKFINKKYRICIYNGCFKQASVNYLNKSKALYCSTHKLDNMVDIKSKKCIKCNIKRPSFNYKNEKKALYCSDCKLNDMFDIKNKKCIKCNNKRSNFNYKNEKNALYCGDCKLENMVDIKNKKCIKCNIKQPNFNYKNEKKGLYCGECKLPDMVDIKNKKCIKCNIKIPVFNYKNENKALYCGYCALSNMVDVKHPKCNLCNLIRGNKKYDYMCSGCYYYTNPNSVLTRNHKSKENQVISDLNKEFNDIIIQDKIISNGCSKRRPDGLIQLNDYNIIIEIDENQHTDYSCENKRLMEIFKDLGNSPLTIIRFNPDAYKYDNKKIKSPFGITKSDGKLKIINQKEYNLRLNKLIETINANLNVIPDKEINVIHLFYNN